MKKTFKIIVSFALCVVLIFCMSSCDNSYENGYHDGYEDGYSDAGIEKYDYGDDMYSRGVDDGYDEAYDEVYDYFVNIIEHDAVHYAKEKGGWHPEEAMCIIDAYENGTLAFGSMPITEEDYKEAVKSLYFYYEYFYGGEYKNK